MQVVFFPVPFSIFVAKIVVSMFCSGNAMFFLKKVLFDLYMAFDIELSMVALEPEPTNH